MAADPHAMRRILQRIDAFSPASIEAHSTRPQQIGFWQDLTTTNPLQDLRPKPKSDYYNAADLRHAVTYQIRSWKKDEYVKIEGVQAVNCFFRKGSMMLKKEYLEKIGYDEGQGSSSTVAAPGRRQRGRDSKGKSSSPVDFGIDVRVTVSRPKGKAPALARESTLNNEPHSPDPTPRGKGQGKRRHEDSESGEYKRNNKKQKGGREHAENQSPRPRVNTVYPSLSGIGDLPDEEVQDSFSKINTLINTLVFTVFSSSQTHNTKFTPSDSASQLLADICNKIFASPVLPESIGMASHSTSLLRAMIWAFLQESILETDIPDDSSLRGAQSSTILPSLLADPSILRANSKLQSNTRLNMDNIFRELALNQLRDPGFILKTIGPAASSTSQSLRDLIMAHTSLDPASSSVPIAPLIGEICTETLTLAAKMAVTADMWEFVRKMPGEITYVRNQTTMTRNLEPRDVAFTVVPAVKWGRAVVVKEEVVLLWEKTETLGEEAEEQNRGKKFLKALTPDIDEKEGGHEADDEDEDSTEWEDVDGLDMDEMRL